MEVRDGSIRIDVNWADSRRRYWFLCCMYIRAQGDDLWCLSAKLRHKGHSHCQVYMSALPKKYSRSTVNGKRDNFGRVGMKRVPLAIITLILFITVATCAVWLAMLSARVIFDV